jgi:hypothetical protein
MTGKVEEVEWSSQALSLRKTGVSDDAEAGAVDKVEQPIAPVAPLCDCGPEPKKKGSEKLGCPDSEGEEDLSSATRTFATLCSRDKTRL